MEKNLYKNKYNDFEIDFTVKLFQLLTDLNLNTKIQNQLPFSVKYIWNDLPWIEQKGEIKKYINNKGILVDDTRIEDQRKQHPYHYTDFIELTEGTYTVSCCGYLYLYKDKQYTEESVVKVFGRYFYDNYYTNTFNTSDYPDAKYMAIGYNHSYNRKGAVRIIRHGEDNKFLESIAKIKGLDAENIEKPLSGIGLKNFGDLLDNSKNKRIDNVYAIAPKEPLKNNQNALINFNLEVVIGDVVAFSNIYSIFKECYELKELTLDITKLKDSVWTAFYACYNLQYLTLKGLGTERVMKQLNDGIFRECNNLWKGEKGHKCAIDSLINYSFNRTEAGYEPLIIELPRHVQNILTEEEQLEIASKGYNLIYK